MVVGWVGRGVCEHSKFGEGGEGRGEVTYVIEDFLPDEIGPVGCYRGEEEGLQLDVAGDELPVHAYSCRCGGFPVEVSTAYEVI